MRAIVWFCFAVAAGTYIAGPIVDPDLWWHITVGRWILANGTVPTEDHWNLFAAGSPWVAYSWMIEAALAAMDRRWGIDGLASSKLFLGAALALSLMYVLSKNSGDWFFGGILGAFCSWAMYNHFTLRPQTIVWVYLAWLIFLAERLRSQGANSGSLVGVAFVFVLWANTHLSTAIGIVFLVCWVWEKNRTRTALAAAATSFAATLITPYLGREWSVLFSKAGHPFAHRAIAEFQSATIMQYSTGFVVILLVLVAACSINAPRAVSLTKLLLAGAFTVAGLAVVKFLPFAYLTLAAVLALYWRKRDIKGPSGKLFEGFERLRAMVLSLPPAGLTFLLICWATVSCVGTLRAPLDQRVPAAAMDYIINKNLGHPILHGFGQGGYIMYRLSDHRGELAHKVVIDGRTNVTPPEVWEMFMAAQRGAENWQDFIGAVNPQTILWQTKSPFTTLLVMDPSWQRVFQSYSADGYSVFVRSQGEKHIS